MQNSVFMSYTFILVPGDKILVVPDAFRRINLWGYKQVVVDNKTSLREIASDIRRGTMVLCSTVELVLLVGRADLLNNNRFVWVLEQLKEALLWTNYQGTVVLTGPLSAFHDHQWMCNDITLAWTECQDFVRNNANFKFCDTGCQLLDKFGVITALLNESGLTLDGLCEVTTVLVW